MLASAYTLSLGVSYLIVKLLKRGESLMCFGYGGFGGYGYGGGFGGSTFVLIVVLFILLIIVGASWY